MSTPDSLTGRVGPTTQPERILALDALRGFALLGILVINIQSFAMPMAAYMNPTVWGDLTGLNRWVWALSHVLTDQKMMTIFSLLFGAGIVLLTTRAEQRGGSPAGVHYRRMFWLLVFGLAHAYGLWYGDILVPYALCGLVVYLFRRLRPGRLLALGLLALCVSSGFYLLFGFSMPYWPPEAVEGFTEGSWRPPAEKLAEEVAAYQGGWLDQMDHRVVASIFVETFLFAIWGGWRAGGLMLIGMALYKLGVFSAERSARFYWTLIAADALVGIPVVVYGVQWNFARGWPPVSLFLGSQFNYWGSLLVSLGWVGALMLLVRAGALGWLTRRLASVGQMAFTNYLLHTIICTTIFYGHGLGLFGEVERTGQILIVFGVWAFQLMVSPLWLARFTMGPFEWLWRALTYGTRPPFRRPAAA